MWFPFVTCLFHFGSSLFHFGYPSSTYDSKAGGNTVVMCINGGEHRLHCGTGPGTTWQSGVSPNQAWPVPRWKQDVAILHFLCFNLFKDVNSQWIEYVETFDKTIHHPMISLNKNKKQNCKGTKCNNYHQWDAQKPKYHPFSRASRKLISLGSSILLCGNVIYLS